MWVIANHLQRNIVKRIKCANYYTLMVDETTDVSNSEQLVIRTKWVDENRQSSIVNEAIRTKSNFFKKHFCNIKNTKQVITN